LKTFIGKSFDEQAPVFCMRKLHDGLFHVFSRNEIADEFPEDGLKIDIHGEE
jgi:hypothetical protein